MSETEPKAQGQHLAPLGTGEPYAQPAAYTLEDFVPILLTLLTPRKALTTVPTFTPKTFVDSIQLYTDGSSFYLYFFIDNAWRSFPAGSAVSQIVAGSGIGLSPGSGIGAVTVSNAGVKSIIAGAGISVSPGGGTGNVTVTNTVTPAMSVKTGIDSRGGSDASGDQTIAHGLGMTPKLVRITAMWGAGTPVLLQSIGTYDGTNNHNVSSYTYVGVGGGAGNSSSEVILISDHGGNVQAATVVFDGTNITVQWTRTGALGGTIYFVWEAYG